MLAELDRVLRYPRVRKIHGLSDNEIEDFVRSIQQVALVVEVDAAKSLRITRDMDDDPVIETAIRTKSSAIKIRNSTPVGEVLLAYVRSFVARFLAAHVSGLSPYASKAQLARIDPVRA